MLVPVWWCGLSLTLWSVITAWFNTGDDREADDVLSGSEVQTDSEGEEVQGDSNEMTEEPVEDDEPTVPVSSWFLTDGVCVHQVCLLLQDNDVWTADQTSHTGTDGVSQENSTANSNSTGTVCSNQ